LVNQREKVWKREWERRIRDERELAQIPHL
jgi:hypothetical protein